MFSIFWLLFYLKLNYLFLGDVGGCSEGGEEDSLIRQHQVIPECIPIVFSNVGTYFVYYCSYGQCVVNLDLNIFGMIRIRSNGWDLDLTKKCNKIYIIN